MTDDAQLFTLEVARLALNLLRTDDVEDNQRSLLAALRPFDDPADRIGVLLGAARMLALQLRETARDNGALDEVLAEVDKRLFNLTTGADL